MVCACPPPPPPLFSIRVEIKHALSCMLQNNLRGGEMLFELYCIMNNISTPRRIFCNKHENKCFISILPRQQEETAKKAVPCCTLVILGMHLFWKVIGFILLILGLSVCVIYKIWLSAITVNVLYLACMIFKLAEFEFLAIWRGFELAFYSNQLKYMYTFINADLAMYLIWRMDTTAKGAKKNTSQNVIHLQ